MGWKLIMSGRRAPQSAGGRWNRVESRRSVEVAALATIVLRTLEQSHASRKDGENFVRWKLHFGSCNRLREERGR